jgi:hypothetical protein
VTSKSHRYPSITTDNLYTQLPSVATGPPNATSMNVGEVSTDSHLSDLLDLHGDPSRPHLTDQRTHEPPDEDDLEFLERRIENGVFLGRRMIITILRAFGTCCSENDLMEVWLRIERIWQPEKRKGLDVLAVKEELAKQLERFRQPN